MRKFSLVLLVLMLISLSILFITACEKKTTEPADTESPTVVITYPANNSIFVIGTAIDIVAEADDNEEIDYVTFYINGVNTYEDTTEPYVYSWDTSNLNGVFTIYAKATDSSENTTTSDIVNVTITNEGEFPNPPSNPEPTNGSTDIPIYTSLSWTCSDPNGDELTYDLYFGTNTSPELLESDLTETNYILETLQEEITYYWYVKATDTNGNPTNGPLWCFTTISLLWEERQILSGSDGENGDSFGYSLSISDGYAIIGAKGDDDNGDLSGSAYIFQNNGDTWIEQSKLIASDGVSDDHFGESVSIFENYALIGAPGDYVGIGSAYIFYRSGSNWIEQEKLTASNASQYDNYGRSVAINEDYAFVGANGRSQTDGVVYVYYHYGSEWIEHSILSASDYTSRLTNLFGCSISISGDFAVIGAYGDDVYGSLSGSAYVFQRIGSEWIEYEKIIPSDGSSCSDFGKSVYIDGDYIIIGADGENTLTGAAYIFVHNGSNWIEQTKLISSDGENGDSFGSSVSISDEIAIIGAWNDYNYGYNSGSAYVFRRIDNDWIEEEKLVPTDVISVTFFGVAASIEEDYTLIGATGNTGSVYVFDYDQYLRDNFNHNRPIKQIKKVKIAKSND